MIVGFLTLRARTYRHRSRQIGSPGKNIPRAVRQVFWRILLFYIFAIRSSA